MRLAVIGARLTKAIIADDVEEVSLASLDLEEHGQSVFKFKWTQGYTSGAADSALDVIDLAGRYEAGDSFTWLMRHGLRKNVIRAFLLLRKMIVQIETTSDPILEQALSVLLGQIIAPEDEASALYLLNFPKDGMGFSDGRCVKLCAALARERLAIHEQEALGKELPNASNGLGHGGPRL
jgi:hypothetical protein